jgi:hypothetical protein
MDTFGSEMFDFLREPPTLGIDKPLLRPLRAKAIPPASPATAVPPARRGVFAFEAISESVEVCSRPSPLEVCALVEVGGFGLVERLRPAPALVPLEPFALLVLALDFDRDPLERLAVPVARVLPPLLVLVLVWAIRGSSPP